ncbi:MAG: HU family DNA-binding protein [Bacilli bacterium]|nr:HU family DNA-binding protein [Bacilli bacterium]
MGKTDLVEVVAAKAGLSKADATRAIDAALEGIKSGLKKEGKVTLVGFGTFKVTKRAARDGRNPLTGKALHIPARNAVSFKAGSKLKDSVN